MRYYEASPAITSSPETVRTVWADGVAWGADGVEGRIAPGQKTTIRSRLAPGRAFAVEVTDFEPLARLRFSGGMPLGLFRGCAPSTCRRTVPG